MKKILMLVTMIMMLAVSAVCSASNGKVLDEEEAIVDKFINGGNYKAVTSMMTEDMQKNWDEKAYNNLHAQLAKDFGKLTTNQLIVVEKHNGADCLLYTSLYLGCIRSVHAVHQKLQRSWSELGKLPVRG